MSSTSCEMTPCAISLLKPACASVNDDTEPADIKFGSKVSSNLYTDQNWLGTATTRRTSSASQPRASHITTPAPAVTAHPLRKAAALHTSTMAQRLDIQEPSFQHRLCPGRLPTAKVSNVIRLQEPRRDHDIVGSTMVTSRTDGLICVNRLHSGHRRPA